MRLVDWDSAGRVTKWRDLREGRPVWEVSMDPATGLPASETTFDQGNPSENATLKFEGRTLTGRTVRDGAGELLYTDKLKRDVPVYLYGCKPKHIAVIRKEVQMLKRRNVRFLVQGRTYKF